jgi:hypothetical protein
MFRSLYRLARLARRSPSKSLGLAVGGTAGVRLTEIAVGSSILDKFERAKSHLIGRRRKALTL